MGEAGEGPPTSKMEYVFSYAFDIIQVCRIATENFHADCRATIKENFINILSIFWLIDINGNIKDFKCGKAQLRLMTFILWLLSRKLIVLLK